MTRTQRSAGMLVDLMPPRDGALSVFRVTGDDAPEFLQNQLAGDLREIDDGWSRLSAHCSPKGRVVGLYRALRDEEGYLLVLPASTAEVALPKLRMMVLRSKAVIEDAGFGVIGAIGGSAADAFAARGWASPGTEERTAHEGAVTTIRLPGEEQRFAVVGPQDELREALVGFGETLGRGEASEWELGEILAGVPQIYPETSEVFLPQFLNLDLLGGVRFDKGCFPGQEVVARTQHLGKIVRRMYRARVEGESEVPAPRTPLRAIDDGKERDGGSVVRAVHDPETDTVEMLVVVPVGVRDQDVELRMNDAEGREVELISLPYPVP